MADGPGARIVDRVGVLVLPDTSKFKPALKNYLERISRTERVEVGVDLDESGLARKTKAATAAASKGAKIEATADLSDGFISQMQRDVRAALKTIEAEVPLTADGERLRREARSKVAELQARMSTMALEVPLDPEAGAAARADLKGEVAELQAMARLNPIEVPLDIDVKGAGAALAGGAAKGLGGLDSGASMMFNPGTIMAVIAAVVAGATVIGSLLAALPGIFAAIALPVGVIALGWEGISRAASELQGPISYLQALVSDTFASELTPVFRELADALPSIGPALQGLASALSGGLGEVLSTLAEPGNMAKVAEIITNISDAITILSPILGPMVETFLDFALVATQAFVDNAPALLSALGMMTGLFQFLVESGILRMAVDLFAQLVIWGTILAGIFMAVMIGLAAISEWANQATGALLGLVGGLGGLALAATIAVTGFMLQFVGLAPRVLAAIAALPGLLLGFIGGMFGQLNAMTGGRLTALIGLWTMLPLQVIGAIGALPGMVLGLIGGMLSQLNGMTGGRLAAAVGIWATLPLRVIGVIASLPGLVLGLIGSLFSRMSGLTSGGIGRVVGFFVQLPIRVMGAIASLPGMVLSLMGGLFSRLGGTTSGGIARAVGIWATLPLRVLGAIAALPGLAMGVVSTAFAMMVGASSGGVTRVVGVIGGLVGQVTGALAGLPGQLYSIGAQMIGELASGMISKLSDVADAARSAAGKVKSYFPGSPVKEGPLRSWNYAQGTSGAGRRLIGDLAAGMRAERRTVASAASRIAGAAADPFGGLSAAGTGGGGIEGAVERALTGWSPVVSMGQRDFYGVMKRTSTARRGR